MPAPVIRTDLTTPPGLDVDITVRLVRINRGRCYRCGSIRVRYSLVAFGLAPLGAGTKRCAFCAGLR